MTTHETALSELAARLGSTDASLSASLHKILVLALEEMIEAECTAADAAASERSSPRGNPALAVRGSCRPRAASRDRCPEAARRSFFPDLREPSPTE